MSEYTLFTVQAKILPRSIDIVREIIVNEFDTPISDIFSMFFVGYDALKSDESGYCELSQGGLLSMKASFRTHRTDDVRMILIDFLNNYSYNYYLETQDEYDEFCKLYSTEH